MPVDFDISENGHFIQAAISGELSCPELFEYEVAHTTDARLRSPVRELLEVAPGSYCQFKDGEVAAIFESRKQNAHHFRSHRCAVVISPEDARSQELTDFFQHLTLLHTPEIIVVFSDVPTARTWLGANDPA